MNLIFRRCNGSMPHWRYLLIPFIGLAITAMFSACGNGNHRRELTADEKYAIVKGREAAERLIKLPRGSMEQEKALLDIRVQEQKLKGNGDTLAAAAYIEAVEQILDSAKVFHHHN